MGHHWAVAGIIFALGLTSQIVGAQTLTISPGAANASGVLISPLDNPVISGSVLITSGQQGARSAEDDWGFNNFELQLLNTCDPTDPFCVAAPDRSVEPALNVWPSLPGTFNSGMTMPVQVHGSRIGLKPTTFQLNEFLPSGTLQPIATASVALDPATIVVPINLVVVIPAASVSSDLNSSMQTWADLGYYKALFDDDWTPNLQRESNEGQIEFIGGNWTQRTIPFTNPGSKAQLNAPSPNISDTIVRPDDVFVQCGIQFRLASVITIEETNPQAVFFTTSGRPDDILNAICDPGGDESLRADLAHWRQTALSTPKQVLLGAFNSSAVTVVFTHLIGYPNCVTTDRGLTDAASKTSGFAVDDGEVASDWLVVSHEIGHSLGMDHPDGNGTGTVTCTNDLMCSGGFAPHIPGCEQWQPAGSQVPFNCEPVANETIPAVASCALARKVAQNAAFSAGNPVPMDPPGSPTSGGAPSGPPGGAPQAWQESNGQLSYDTSIFTEGTASLRIGGSGYNVVTSPTFRTADWFQVGTQMALDVYLPAGQPNQWWFGSLDLSANIPAAGVYNAYLGHVELTGMTVGQWNTVQFTLTDAVRTALLGDFPGGTLSIAVDTPSGAPDVRLDNLQMDGALTDRTTFHQGSLTGGATSSLFSFDTAADWSITNGTLEQVSTPVTQGSAALQVSSAGYALISSRFFSTSELSSVTSTLSVDLFVPTQQPNQWWFGSLSASVSCPMAGIFQAYIGQRDITGLFTGEYNTLTFPTLPTNVVSALQTPGIACQVQLALNVPAGAGEYDLDNLAFR